MSPRQQAPLTFEYVLLGILSQQPTHGYEIYKAITRPAGIGLVWKVKQSQLYALLDKLENSGLITATLIPGENHPARHEYALTEAGRILFAGWLKSPVMSPQEMQPDFLARLYFALQQGEGTALELIRQQQITARDWLAQQQKHLSSLTPQQPFEQMVDQFRISQIEASLNWLQTLAESPGAKEKIAPEITKTLSRETKKRV